MVAEDASTQFKIRRGPLIGLAVGAALGLVVSQFVEPKALISSTALTLGVFIGMAADRRLSKRERMIGGAAALVIFVTAMTLLMLYLKHR